MGITLICDICKITNTEGLYTAQTFGRVHRQNYVCQDCISEKLKDPFFMFLIDLIDALRERVSGLEKKQ